MYNKVAVGIVGLLALVWSGGGALAAAIPYKPGEIYYQFDEEPLRNFLEGFFAEQGLPVVLSPAASRHTGTLNGPRSGPPGQVFQSIAASNNLLSYFDNAAVYIYKAEELQTRYVTVAPSRVAGAMRLVRDMRMADSVNTVRAARSGGVIAVAGAPRFVDQVVRLIDASERQQVSAVAATPPPDSTLRYFRLRYAWAADISIMSGNRDVTVPGVASILRAVANPGSMPAGTVERLIRPSAQRLRGTGLAEIQSGPGQASYEQQVGGLVQYNSEAAVVTTDYPAPDPSGPQIIADPFRNGVIVRDVEGRMPLYEYLIGVFDVEPMLVEIEATIIDVDTQELEQLGVNLRFRTSDSELVFGPQGTKEDFVAAQNADDVDLLPALAGLSAGVIVGDSRRFAISLNALAENGTVNIVSRPQLITLNDMEAIIESNREVFVPVGGFREVDLFNVVAGTVLRVTPHIIESLDSVKIRISTTIEDGDVQLISSSVQNVEIPVVDRNIVTTQAIIKDGQSLLLGGLRRDSRFDRKTEVPVLRRIPLLGKLFRQVKEEQSRIERLFLITPRLVSAERAAQMSKDLEQRIAAATEAMQQ